MQTFTFVPDEAPRHIAEIAPTEFLTVGGPIYDPPYETQLEDELAWHLVKYLRRQTRLEAQVRLATPGGVFWVDFLLTLKGQRIALECGTLEAEEEADFLAYRDALLVGSGVVDAVYRFSGESLFHHLNDCLYVFANLHRAAFTERSLINLDCLASAHARSYTPTATEQHLTVTFEDAPSLQISRMRQVFPKEWMDTYTAALQHFGIAGVLAKSA